MNIKLLFETLSTVTWLIFTSLIVTSLIVTSPALAESDLEAQVNVETVSDQFNPIVETLADGRFLVVWVDFKAQPYALEGRLLDASGLPVGDEFVVSPSGSHWKRLRDATRTSDGSIMLLWAQRFTGPRFQRLSAVGQPMGSEVLVPGTHENSSTRAAAGDDNTFLVAWDCNFECDTGDSIHTQLFDADGSALGSSTVVPAPANTLVYLLTMTRVLDDEFLVVWRDDIAGFSPDDIRGRRFDASGSPIGGAFTIREDVTWSSSVKITAIGPDSLALVVESRDDDLVAVEKYDLIGDNLETLATIQIPADATTGSPLIYDLALATNGDLLISRDSGGPAGFLRLASDGTLLDAVYRASSFDASRASLDVSGDEMVMVWASDGSFGDDDSETSVQVRGSFTSIFFDDFEIGNTDRWDLIVPSP
ncbi:MAG: hypothetical protein AAFY88_02450 [Acidobacteriota bacterium]